MAAGGLSRWGLVLAAALLMVWRAPAYVLEPSFWAEEGTLYFAFAWDHPVHEALTYRPAGYLLLWANLATTLAARLVRGGLLPLAHAPQVTVLFALAAQLVPVAVIAWSRAPFWDGTLRRSVGIAILLFGVLTDEIWLNTVNSQPWLVLAAALLLLEPAAGGRLRTGTAAGVLVIAGLSAPVASALAPLYVWRAWRERTRPALAQAGIVVGCAVVQAGCVWASVQAGQSLPARATGLSPGTFAATVWMRTLVLPLLGVPASEDVGAFVTRSGGIGAGVAVLLLVLAGALVAWLAYGLRAAERLPLAGGYALVTTVTLLSVAGDTTLLLYSPWISSRYAYVPGTLVLLMMLGNIRGGGGWVWPVLCGLVLLARLGQGIADYRSSVPWQADWPRWAEQVRAWQADAAASLAIWPTPWSLSLSALTQASRGPR